MVYIIRKKTNYQDLGHKRIDVGLNYVEEKYIDSPKEYALFGAEYGERFLEEDVFFDDKIGAYTECAKRNKELINSILQEIDTSNKEEKKNDSI